MGPAPPFRCGKRYVQLAPPAEGPRPARALAYAERTALRLDYE